MTRLNVNDARCEALFVSDLRRWDAPTAARLAEIISCTVQQFGVRGCAGRMAQEFGDYPEAAADRMRWIRQLVAEVSVSPPPRLSSLGGQSSACCCPDAGEPAAGGLHWEEANQDGGAAPGGLPPVGRGMLPPRSRRGPLLPSALALAVPLRSSSRFPRLTSAFCARPRPGPSWPGAPEACP
jgi:hypothetical protein